MIKSLKRLFTRGSLNSSAARPAPYRPKKPNNPNFLTDPIKLEQLLRQIEINRPLCTVTFDDSKEEFSTTILDLDQKKKRLILDEITPNRGNDLLHCKKKLKLSTFHNGIHLAFKLNRIQFATDNGIAYYKASYPERIYYPQRRKSPRIGLANTRISFSGISSRTRTSMGGVVYDISRDGIGIILTDNRARLQRGDTATSCSITLNDQQIHFELDIRFVKRTGTVNNPQIFAGGYYQQLDSRSQNKLSYFVAAMEREHIRNQKNHQDLMLL